MGNCINEQMFTVGVYTAQISNIIEMGKGPEGPMDTFFFKAWGPSLSLDSSLAPAVWSFCHVSVNHVIFI